MVMQTIYTGWALFGIVIFAAMLLTLLHAILRRSERVALLLSLAAFVCLVATQVIFWMFTYPMNVASSNWTVTPDHFETARRQWEYSHAASAVLTFLALVAIAAAVAVDAGPPQRRSSTQLR
jgi:membrane-anchored protein YejM (alkaline phosphatase superfamily)